MVALTETYQRSAALLRAQETRHLGRVKYPPKQGRAKGKKDKIFSPSALPCFTQPVSQ